MCFLAPVARSRRTREKPYRKRPVRGLRLPTVAVPANAYGGFSQETVQRKRPEDSLRHRLTWNAFSFVLVRPS